MVVTIEVTGPGVGLSQEPENVSEMYLCHWPEDQVNSP